MNPYLGNAFADMERAIHDGRTLTLSIPQMKQVLAENAALVTKANELVRENIELRKLLALPAVPTGV